MEPLASKGILRPKKHPHSVRMGLTPGDILVVATNNGNLKVVETIKVEEISHNPNSIDWCVTAHSDLVNIKLTQPVSIFKSEKGTCTLFTIEVADGYRVHYLDYLKRSLPSLYRQAVKGGANDPILSNG